jgi:hypothetical protein
MGEEETVYRVFVLKPEGKMPFGNPRRRFPSTPRFSGSECKMGDWMGWGCGVELVKTG